MRRARKHHDAHAANRKQTEGRAPERETREPAQPALAQAPGSAEATAPAQAPGSAEKTAPAKASGSAAASVAKAGSRRDPKATQAPRVRRHRKYFNRKGGLSLRGKEAGAAYIFLIPFLIGLIGIFVPTIVQSVRFSFSDMSVGAQGYELTQAANHGFAHYIYALSIDPTFTRELLAVIRDMFVQVPLVLIFSFFVANLLNQEFHGRTVARSIFFFPVILTSGIILAIERQDLLLNEINGEDMSQMEGQVSAMLNVGRLLLKYTELPHNVVSYLTKAITGIYDIAIASGVQILIFLAGLQAISPSLFEASTIEGATGWENFWKITFPMISPLIIVNGLYSIIDSFTRSSNPMMTDIQQTIFGNVQYGYGSAKAWIYFISIILVIAIAGGLVKNRVVYTD